MDRTHAHGVPQRDGTTSRRDTDVRVVVVTGTPPAFCVGGDSDALADHAERGSYDTGLPPEPARPGEPDATRVRRRLRLDARRTAPRSSPRSTALPPGIGLALALFCDLRFGAAPAKLTTAAPKLGLPAEYGMSWILPRLIGATRAADLILSGRVVTVAETESMGALERRRCTTARHALPPAHDYAACWSRRPGPAAVSTAKAQLYHDLHRHDAAASVAESKRLLDEAMATAEYREGVAALRDKRPPRF